MSALTKYLFIEGPWNGKRKVVIGKPKQHKVLINRPVVGIDEDQDVSTAHDEYFDYMRINMFIGGPVFYAPMGTSPRKALNLLIEGYGVND